MTFSRLNLPLLILLGSLCAGECNIAFAGQNVCLNAWKTARARLQEAAKRYSREWVETKPIPLRLVLKPYQETPAFHEAGAGQTGFRRFLSKSGWVLSTIDPFNLTYRWVIKKPLGWLTQRALGARYMLSRTVLIPTSIFAYNEVYDLTIEQPFQRALDEKLQTIIQQHGAETSEYILWDYRFESLLESFNASAGDSAARAGILNQAYLIQTAYSQYYQFLNGTLQSIRSAEPGIAPAALDRKLREVLSSEETWNTLKDFVLFADLSPLFEKGIQADAAEGFSIPPGVVGKALPRSTRAEILAIQSRLFVRYEMISEAFGDTATYRQDPVRIEEIRKIREAPFTQMLQAKLAAAGVPLKKIVYYLQEDAYWASQFEIWEALGVVRLRATGDGFDAEPLTLELIREETFWTIGNSNRPTP